MASTEICIVCGRAEGTHPLGVWLVAGARALVHAVCWIAEYETRAPRLLPHGIAVTPTAPDAA